MDQYVKMFPPAPDLNYIYLYPRCTALEQHFSELLPDIDKLYTQISNVNRLHNIIEPFAPLFWALGIVLAHVLQ